MYDNEVTYYTRDNMLLVKDFLDGYSSYDWLRYRSNSPYYYKVAKGVLLGRVHLPVSSGLYRLFFPDHCPSTTVFHAVLFHREINGEKYWFPAIVTACSHFEHGLPDLADMVNLLKLSEVVGIEAFGYNYDVHTDVDIADDTVEKLVMVTYIYDSELGMMWDSVGKALRRYTSLVNEQLKEKDVLNKVKQFIGDNNDDS